MSKVHQTTKCDTILNTTYVWYLYHQFIFNTDYNNVQYDSLEYSDVVSVLNEHDKQAFAYMGINATTKHVTGQHHM